LKKSRNKRKNEKNKEKKKDISVGGKKSEMSYDERLSLSLIRISRSLSLSVALS